MPKTAWDYFKEGFQPMKARADEDVKEDDKTRRNQYRIDMRSSKEDRVKKFKKGFLGKE